MPANYTAADALLYVRELLDNHLDWMHETLAEEYGLEMIDGEEYLPDVPNEVMSCLYSIQRDITAESIAVGLHIHGTDGRLYRPRTYSTGHPVYLEVMTGPEGDQFPVTCLQHPDGRNLYRDDQASRSDEMPTMQGENKADSTARTTPDARRAGLHIVPRGDA